MSDYREIARNMLEGDEGVRLKPYCDKCGKPWMECEIERLGFISLYDFASEDDHSLSSLRRICEEHDVCPGGKITIAMGRNLEDRALSDKEVDLLAQNDIIRNEIAACDFIGEGYFFKLSLDRRAVLLCLAHWGGLESAKMFSLFTRAALNTEPDENASYHYGVAAEELLWKDGRDHSLGRSGWWNISQPRIERYAAIWRGEG